MKSETVHTNQNKRDTSVDSRTTPLPYEPPGITFVEELEVVAGDCGKGDGTECPDGPLTS